MNFIYNDGGRKTAGYQGRAGDCVARSIAIATGKPYQEVYTALAEGTGKQRARRRTGLERQWNVPARKSSASARNGIDTRRKWFRDYMASIGWRWVPTMQIGQGCKVHLADGELPPGRLIVAVSKHYTAVIDGAVQDTHNPQRESGRCVYGYWIKA